jgi:predicted helicase
MEFDYGEIRVSLRYGERSGRKRRNYPADDDDSGRALPLCKDISQRNNLAKKFPKKVAELQKELKNAERVVALPLPD